MYEWTVRCSLVMTLVLSSLSNCDESTQQYLENAVRSLKSLRQLQTIGRHDATSPKRPEKFKIQRRSHRYANNVPPLSLTKGELAAMYEEAVAKGASLKFDKGNNEYVHALVHHLDEDAPPEKHPSSSYMHEDEPPPHDDPPADDHPHHEASNEDNGYYYYYYPIKSFLDEITSHPPEEHGPSHHTHQPSYHHKELTTYKPPYSYHSHHHQHNITIQTADKDMKEAKPMEHPLLMALSGFIGMALMLVVSTVVSKLSSKPKSGADIKKKDNLDDFARFALNAIEGNCAERFACELTKTARSFDMEDNRFYKLLKRVAPGAFGRFIKNSGKYTNKQLQCTAIPCKRRRPNSNNNNQNRRPQNNLNQKKKNNPNKKF